MSDGSVDIAVFGGTIGAILTVLIVFVLVFVALVIVSKYRNNQMNIREANDQSKSTSPYAHTIMVYQ